MRNKPKFKSLFTDDQPSCVNQIKLLIEKIQLIKTIYNRFSIFFWIHLIVLLDKIKQDLSHYSRLMNSR